MTKSTKDLVVIPCPNFAKFKIQPDDQSKCELIDCPMCGEKMWLSEKKMGVLEISRVLDKDIVIGCYDCIEKFAIENKLLFKGSLIKPVNL